MLKLLLLKKVARKTKSNNKGKLNNVILYILTVSPEKKSKLILSTNRFFGINKIPFTCFPFVCSFPPVLTYICTFSPFVIKQFNHKITKSSFHSFAGRTRTKDKYRVVYSDHQRLELEKEFHYSRYITIRRKAELANSVGLSERQVKIINFLSPIHKRELQNHRRVYQTAKFYSHYI